MTANVRADTRVWIQIVDGQHLRLSNLAVDGLHQRLSSCVVDELRGRTKIRQLCYNRGAVERVLEQHDVVCILDFDSIGVGGAFVGLFRLWRHVIVGF